MSLCCLTCHACLHQTQVASHDAHQLNRSQSRVDWKWLMQPSIYLFFSVSLFGILYSAVVFFNCSLFKNSFFNAFVVVVNLNIFWLKSKLPWRFWSLMFFNQCRRGFCSKTHWAVYVGTILRHLMWKSCSTRLQLDIWPNSSAALHTSWALNANPQCNAVRLVIKMAYEAYTYNSFETKVLIKNSKIYYFTLYFVLE